MEQAANLRRLYDTQRVVPGPPTTFHDPYIVTYLQAVIFLRRRKIKTLAPSFPSRLVADERKKPILQTWPTYHLYEDEELKQVDNYVSVNQLTAKTYHVVLQSL